MFRPQNIYLKSTGYWKLNSWKNPNCAQVSLPDGLTSIWLLWLNLQLQRSKKGVIYWIGKGIGGASMSIGQLKSESQELSFQGQLSRLSNSRTMTLRKNVPTANISLRLRNKLTAWKSVTYFNCYVSRIKC
ncbi:hypothetical protein CEXT_504271 [Caerostris extrusa]|uniref:Uncharacterized protein n=1 Tax=Caerostris extrusa TaxID=172846 RepID=A0AAV4SVX7_CAEEX|nr:hypothetical protein CEXT_504271 [Caerostris extrusa]